MRKAKGVTEGERKNQRKEIERKIDFGNEIEPQNISIKNVVDCL